MFAFTSKEYQKNIINKRTKKLQKQGNDSNTAELKPSDILKRIKTIRCKDVLSGFDCYLNPFSNHKINLAISTIFNNIQIISFDFDPKLISESDSFVLEESFSHLSNPTEVIYTQFNSDDSFFMAVMSKEIKIWYWEEMKTFRTFETLAKNEQFTCACFFSNDLLVAGSNQGNLYMFDVETGILVSKINAHGSSEVKSIKPLYSDYLVSVSFDNCLVQWNFTDKTLQIQSKVDLEEKVLSMSISPDLRNIIVSLLNNNLKVLNSETLKVRLNLYGNSLPVMCSDVSFDSKVLITGSLYKNIKFWGFNFGDCHASRFAHDEGVLSVQFKPNTMICFSAGKDSLIKVLDTKNASFLTIINGNFNDSFK